MVQYLAAFRNEKGHGPVAQLFSDDPNEIDEFVAKHDRPGFAVYRCVSPLKDSATRRCLDDVARIERLCIDLDFKDIEETEREVDDKLLQLPLPATWVRNSGGGRHIELGLKEPIEADDPEFPKACALLKRLTACLSGDPAPAHPAALLRELGTHNTKRGDSVLVQTLWGSGEPVDVSEIEALCDLLPDAGIFKLKPKLRGNGHSGGEYAVHDEPVNVDARFAEMQFEGPGDSAVHQTELHVAASLLRRGMSVEFTVLTVLEETQKALLNDPRTATWDWGAER